MNKLQFIVISIMLIVSAIAIYTKLKLDYIAQLSDLLYKKKDPKAYLDRLEKPKTKLFIPGKRIELMKLSFFQSVGDTVNIDEQYEILKRYRMTDKEKLSLDSTRLLYLIREEKKEEAAELMNEIGRLADKINDEEARLIGHESMIAYRLNVLNDPDLEQVLLQDLETSKDENERCTAYLRLAKLAYLNGKEKEIYLGYLESAKKISQNGGTKRIIEECLKQPELLEEI